MSQCPRTFRSIPPGPSTRPIVNGHSWPDQDTDGTMEEHTTVDRHCVCVCVRERERDPVFASRVDKHTPWACKVHASRGSRLSHAVFSKSVRTPGSRSRSDVPENSKPGDSRKAGSKPDRVREVQAVSSYYRVRLFDNGCLKVLP